MSMSVSSIALSGMNAASRRMDAAAVSIADMTTSTSSGSTATTVAASSGGASVPGLFTTSVDDPAAALSDMLGAKMAYAVAAKSMMVDRENMQVLLDAMA